jgi:SAM-dependent methyltransferase
MKPDEYRTMFEVEDTHWWYRGLRENLALYWNRYFAGQTPRILDVGCGTGALLEWLKQRTQPFGIDFSIDAIRFCRQRGHEQSAVASALALPCAPKSFDVVLSFDMLPQSSMPDKRVPLREMHAILKPGGLLFLNVPAYQWLHSSHDAAVLQDRRFSRRELRGMLQTTGFACLEITYWNTLLFPLILPVRLWRKLAPPAQSDLADKPGNLSNALFGQLLGIERKLMKRCPLPFGLSLFVIARKK